MILMVMPFDQNGTAKESPRHRGGNHSAGFSELR